MISEDTLDKVRELPIETVVGQYVKLSQGRTYQHERTLSVP